MPPRFPRRPRAAPRRRGDFDPAAAASATCGRPATASGRRIRCACCWLSRHVGWVRGRGLCSRLLLTLHVGYTSVHRGNHPYVHGVANYGSRRSMLPERNISADLRDSVSLVFRFFRVCLPWLTSSISSTVRTTCSSWLLFSAFLPLPLFLLACVQPSNPTVNLLSQIWESCTCFLSLNGVLASTYSMHCSASLGV